MNEQKKVGDLECGVCPVHGTIGGTSKHLGFDHERRVHICLTCIRDHVANLEMKCKELADMAGLHGDHGLVDSRISQLMAERRISREELELAVTHLVESGQCADDFGLDVVCTASEIEGSCTSCWFAAIANEVGVNR